MSNYTIEAIKSDREFESKYGPLKSYKVQIKGDDGFDGEAEITQKPTTPAPQVGQQIEGTLDTSNPKFPPKLKKAQGGGAPRGGSKSPKDTDSIERQVAYKGAVELAVAFGKDAESAKQVLSDMFEVSVALIQGKKGDPVAVAQSVFPGAKEVGPEITREQVVSAYKGWVNVMTAHENDAETIAKTFEMKKTALGIANLDDASQDQRKALMEYLTGV